MAKRFFNYVLKLLKINKDSNYSKILIGALVVFGVCSSFFWGNDNKLEQACEFILEIFTGKKMDLSPESEKDATPLIEQKTENE